MLNSRQASTLDVFLVHKNIPQISIEEALAFIRAHNELTAWSDDDIRYEISKASRRAALAFTTDEHGRLIGICFGEWQENATVFFCHCLIAPKQFKHYVESLRKIHPQCTEIRGIRGENLTKTYKV